MQNRANAAEYTKLCLIIRDTKAVKFRLWWRLFTGTGCPCSAPANQSDDSEYLSQRPDTGWLGRAELPRSVLSGVPPCDVS